MNKKRSIGIVEILSLSIIITLLIIITVPNVSKIVKNFKKDLFVNYIENISDLGEKVYLKSSSDKDASIHVYEIGKDFHEVGLAQNDDVKGYLVVDSREINNIKYYLFVHDNDFQIVNKDISYKKVSRDNLESYNKAYWLNVNSAYQACRVIEPDTSYNCLNKKGYIIAQ